jgi:hypothetical protein
MNAEQAELEAERRFQDYRAEATCTCGVYRLALSPRMLESLPGDAGTNADADAAARAFELTDPRLYSEGSSYETALANANPPPLAELERRDHPSE